MQHDKNFNLDMTQTRYAYMHCVKSATSIIQAPTLNSYIICNTPIDPHMGMVIEPIGYK